MTLDWHQLCTDDDFEVVANQITVTLGHGRSQRVRVRQEAEYFEIWAIVARRVIVDQMQEIDTDCWTRNRTVSPVGFRLDASRRLLAFGIVPKAGCTGAEFDDMVREVAREADRTEFRLTGKDRE